MYIEGHWRWCLEQQCENQKMFLWILLARLHGVSHQNQLTCDFKNIFSLAKEINAAFIYCWLSKCFCIFQGSNHDQVDFAGVCSNIEKKGGPCLKAAKRQETSQWTDADERQENNERV